MTGPKSSGIKSGVPAVGNIPYQGFQILPEEAILEDEKLDQEVLEAMGMQQQEKFLRRVQKAVEIIHERQGH